MKIKSEEKIRTPKLKRLFDIAFSFILLIITLPLFILFLVLIFVEHILRGQILAPLFFREFRISQGEPFKLIKFNIFNPRVIRNMKRKGEFINTKELEHEKGGLIVAGKLIQKIYLDELPQLINILKGDISVVGPRPVNLETYAKEIERKNYTKSVIKTGLTGSYQSRKGENGISQKILDEKYIEFCKNNSPSKIILKDVKIIFRTIKVMIKAEGI